ncbi:NAD(P)/FAD-dependent oxidoreductase [Asticcacaulis tiandongensis]|uniref:NAD(P)/FAD-dependent oxidoreductase n=1 Tax=Asticcacaulis tiandongensis TaxID=2565365 RepID=UPI00112CC169|nr:NAD(P)/FAD-dependent oxidoreductase [Asticcacaulis tiandongensis]
MKPSTHLDVGIIGGGPAGCACALWLHKLGVTAHLIEGANRLGGLQARSPYENLWLPGVQGRTGQAVAQAFQTHLDSDQVPYSLNQRVHHITPTPDGFALHTDTGTLTPRFVVIATGTLPRSGPFIASDTVLIGPGVDIENTPVEGRKIAVLGGGDNAYDQARFLRDRNAAEVVIFSRSPPRGQTTLRQLIPDVPIRIGPYHADQHTMTINDEYFDLFAVMYGFEAIIPEGLIPDLDNGYIRVNRFGETSIANLYACGEVTDYWHPCVATATAHGIQVAKQISLRL